MRSIRSRWGAEGRIKKGKICRKKKRGFGVEFVSPKFGGKMGAIVGQTPKDLDALRVRGYGTWNELEGASMTVAIGGKLTTPSQYVGSLIIAFFF